MYIVIIIIFLLSLFCFLVAEATSDDDGCLPGIFALIGLSLLILSGTLLYNKTRWERQKTIDYIYDEGYKRGQIFCINGEMLIERKLNRESEYVYQDVEILPSADQYIDKQTILNLYDDDEIFKRGFRRGQIDCFKGIIEYERISNDDGEVKFRKIK